MHLRWKAWKGRHASNIRASSVLCSVRCPVSRSEFFTGRDEDYIVGNNRKKDQLPSGIRQNAYRVGLLRHRGRRQSATHGFDGCLRGFLRKKVLSIKKSRCCHGTESLNGYQHAGRSHQVASIASSEWWKPQNERSRMILV